MQKKEKRNIGVAFANHSVVVVIITIIIIDIVVVSFKSGVFDFLLDQKRVNIFDGGKSNDTLDFKTAFWYLCLKKRNWTAV